MKQVSVRVESDVEITTEVQVDKDTVVAYNNFTPQGHECLLREIEITKQRKGESICTNETLSDVERALVNSSLPLYRQGLRLNFKQFSGKTYKLIHCKYTLDISI